MSGNGNGFDLRFLCFWLQDGCFHKVIGSSAPGQGIADQHQGTDLIPGRAVQKKGDCSYPECVTAKDCLGRRTGAGFCGELLERAC